MCSSPQLCDLFPALYHTLCRVQCASTIPKKENRWTETTTDQNTECRRFQRHWRWHINKAAESKVLLETEKMIDKTKDDRYIIESNLQQGKYKKKSQYTENKSSRSHIHLIKFPERIKINRDKTIK